MRYLWQNLVLSVRDFLKNSPKTLFSSFGILFLIAFLVVYMSLRSSVQEYIGGKLFGTMQINDIVISPKSKAIPTSVESPEQLVSTISFGNVARISKMKGIAQVQPIIRMNYIVRVKLEFMGQSRAMYMPLVGIPRSFLQKTNPQKWQGFYATKDSIPIIVPRFVLDLFNNYAALRDLPLFNESVLAGFPLELTIRTTSSDDAETKKIDFKGKVYDFTSAFSFSGLVVPSDFIVQFCNEHRNDSKRKMPGYSCIMLNASVKDIKDLPELTRQIESMGLKVESQRDIAAKTNKALSVIDGFSILIIAIFMILTVIAIFESYLNIVYTRSYKFSLQRVIGVSKMRIILNFVMEAAIIGALYGLIGYIIGHYAVKYLAANITTWIPALKGLVIRPQGQEVLLIAAALSAVISAAAAFFPAIFASSMNLFKAVRK